MFTIKQKAIVSVINDLVSDNRVRKTCETLSECGYKVTLIGRRLPASPAIPAEWHYHSVRMNLLFTKGPLFYLFFNLRLFFKLLFNKADLLFANDLDTLLPNYLVSRLKKIPLIYDSHELFCEVPELLSSPFKRQIWLRLEKFVLPRLSHCITVNESIAGIFEKKYGVPFSVVRNIPDPLPPAETLCKKDLALPEDKKIILLQGAGINIDRGAEELVEAMRFLGNNILLLIIGSGDVWRRLENMVVEKGLTQKVKMISRVPRGKLMMYTKLADLGLTIDKDSNLNYRYSLPNKLFDYINAGTPVLASRLPEIEKIVTQYDIGGFIDNHQPEHIAAQINNMLESRSLSRFRQNTLKAAADLNWTNEKEMLKQVIESAAKSRSNNY